LRTFWKLSKNLTYFDLSAHSRETCYVNKVDNYRWDGVCCKNIPVGTLSRYLSLIYAFLNVNKNVHFIKDSGLNQKMDPELAVLIELYVRENINNTSEIKNLLKNHVHHQIFKGENLPEPSNKRFYPPTSTILQHIRRAQRKISHSLFDQDCLQQKIKEWTDNDSTANTYFRPRGLYFRHEF